MTNVTAPTVRTPGPRRAGGPRPPRKAGKLMRVASGTAVLAVVAAAQVGLVLAPSQHDRHPLLVLALRPTPAFLVLVGDLVAPVAAILMASTGRTLVDVAYFAVARHGALPLVQRFGIGRRMAHGVSSDRATGGLLALTFFWSSTPVIVALGLSHARLGLFLAVTGAGNLTTSGAFVLLGQQLTPHLAPVVAWLTANGTALTFALLAALLVGGATGAGKAAAMSRAEPEGALHEEVLP